MSLKLTSDEAKTKGKKNGFVKFCAYIAGTILLGFIIFTFITTNMKINDSQAQYNELLAQTNEVKENSASIQRYLEEDANMEQYIEDIARDKLDFANPDERVYYIVPDAE